MSVQYRKGYAKENALNLLRIFIKQNEKLENSLQDYRIFSNRTSLWGFYTVLFQPIQEHMTGNSEEDSRC